MERQFVIEGGAGWKGEKKQYVVNIDALPGTWHSRYTITLNGVPIRKQITRPDLGDCQQGEFDARAGTRKEGFTP